MEHDWIRDWCSKVRKIRAFELALAALYRQGCFGGTMHLSIGQEIVPVARADHLQGRDVVFASHRGHAPFLAVTNGYEDLLRELLGLEGMATAGRGGSQHLCVPGRFYSNGILGGMAPIAAGFAQGFKHAASHDIATVFLGDGSLG